MVDIDSCPVKLISSDNKVFEVTYGVAKMSGTIKNMVEGK
jgi:hypothetical protein